MSTRSPFQSEAPSGFIAVGGRRADLALDDGLAGDAGGPGLALLLGVLLGGEGVLRAAGADAVGVGGRRSASMNWPGWQTATAWHSE